MNELRDWLLSVLDRPTGGSDAPLFPSQIKARLRDMLTRATTEAEVFFVAGAMWVSKIYDGRLTPPRKTGNVV